MSRSAKVTDEPKKAIIETHLGGHLLDVAEPPPSLKVYDVWNFPKCDPNYGGEYPGRIPGQVIENLLWYYTEPFANVYDPFAGSGTTIDVSRAMFRRYFATDIRPHSPLKGIVEHDITAGAPSFPKGYKMGLIFMDPPYWSMKKTDYAPESVSALTLEGYYEAMLEAAKNCRMVAAEGGKLALLVQNQTGAGKGGFSGYLDHAFELRSLFERVGWKATRRISVPITPDNSGGANEAKAKEDKRMLGLVRDLIVFEANDE